MSITRVRGAMSFLDENSSSLLGRILDRGSEYPLKTVPRALIEQIPNWLDVCWVHAHLARRGEAQAYSNQVLPPHGSNSITVPKVPNVLHSQIQSVEAITRLIHSTSAFMRIFLFFRLDFTPNTIETTTATITSTPPTTETVMIHHK